LNQIVQNLYLKLIKSSLQKHVFIRLETLKKNLISTIKIERVADDVACNSEAMKEAAINLYKISKGLSDI